MTQQRDNKNKRDLTEEEVAEYIKENYISMKEYATILDITTMSVSRRIQNGMVPALQVGQTVLVRKPTADEILEAKSIIPGRPSKKHTHMHGAEVVLIKKQAVK